MTENEAIEAIISNYPNERYSILREALDMSIDLLKKQEKYKWHDLRKNPDDLPEEYESVFARFKNTSRNKKETFSHST